MKKSVPNPPSPRTKPSRQRPRAGAPGLIHPVVIFPFLPPARYSDLEELYRLVARLNSDRNTYARPITVLDRKTRLAGERDRRFRAFQKNVVGRHSEVLEGWSVDTCQMWYVGLGAAFDQGGPDDVYWLIPGDFNYGTAVGHEVLSRLHDLPEICQELQQDICIGEIATDHSDSKQLIDTYGTFALLYTWFPAETGEIRGMTERPRSEFLAIRHDFLREALAQRWFAYEQTVVMLLQAVFGKKRISRFLVGNISDLPEGGESLASAMRQVERTEGVLKTLWRERHEARAGWIDEYWILEKQSEQVRRTALTILHNLLT